jgi:hypothetical protein
MFWSKRSLSLSVLAVSAALYGCSSTSVAPVLDATADGPLQVGDGAATESGPEASTPDATMSADSDATASTPDAGIPEGSVEASPDSAGPDGDATGGGPSDDASEGGLDSASDGASDGGDGASDGGSDGASDGGSDGASDDGGSDGAWEAGEGGTATHLLVPGTTLTIFAATSDDYLIYYDSSTQTYYARPLSGGPATTIYTAPLSAYGGYCTIINKLAFCWSWNSNYIGTLIAWSSGTPQGATLTTTGLAYLYQTMWASDDSKHVAFVQNTSADATVGDIYGANADGSGVTLLLSNIDINSSFSGQAPGCFPRVVFRGDHAVVSSCTVRISAGLALAPTLQIFSISNGWARTALVPNVVDSLQFNPLDRNPFTFPFAVDPDGGRIVTASASSGNGALQVFPTDGGPGTVVDPGVQVSSSLSFTGSVTNPWSILYNNSAGALLQAYAANPTPKTLVEAGVNYFNALSSDGQWMLVSNNPNNNLGWFADLSLVSTQTPGTPVPVALSSQYGGLPITPRAIYAGGNRGFTTDNAYVLVMTNLIETGYNRWLGYLRSMSVTPPYTMKLLSTGYMVDYVPLRRSKVVVGDNYQRGDGGTSPTVDIDVVDPASDGSAANIAKGVPGDSALSNDQTQIAYTVKTGAAPGIYVSPVP